MTTLGSLVAQAGVAGEEARNYKIQRSLRFNSADSAYLNRTPASAGNRKTWTWSGWVKRGALTGDNRLFGAGTSNSDRALIAIEDYLSVVGTNSGSNVLILNTTPLYRDPSAWYHMVIAIDTTQATSSNRAKIYVNGAEVTSFVAATYPSQNTDLQVNSTNPHVIGTRGTYQVDSNFDGYMTEINFIDGSALDPTSFGEFNTDTGVWQPKAYTGSYGTNGFYLNFSDNSTTDALGTDFSGNDNTWDDNNFSVTAGAGNDSLVDTPTPYGTDTGVGGQVRGNYCTLNPLAKGSIIALANGNLDASSSGTNYSQCLGTIGMSSGKWYWEVTVSSVTGTSLGIGIAKDTTNLASYGGDIGSFVYTNNGEKGSNDSFSGYGNSFTANDVIGVAFDADAGEIKFYKNNTVQNSGTPAFTGLTAGPYLPVVADQSTGAGNNWSIVTNFGQRPFAYTAPSGFKALCTQNLPEPTIVDGSEYFNTVLYTGNGSTNAITGVGHNPDLVWIKNRSGANNHVLFDDVRGESQVLYSNLTNAEDTLTGQQTIDDDGFTLGGGYPNTNASGNSYVAWNWVANGAPTANNNSDGSITSTVSVNPTSGFSIVTYAGNSTAAATVGHGLGVTPSMVIVKNRSGAYGWIVRHFSLSATQNIALQNTDGAYTVSSATSHGGIGTLTSTTFTFISGTVDLLNVNANSNNYVAYCFAAIPGYSAFGSYTGNGSADGPLIHLGFKPAFVLIKSSTLVVGWVVLDAARDPYNVAFKRLNPNSSASEGTNVNAFDMLSNGFKLRTDDNAFNQNAATYIYMAFASNPFKYSLAR
jgi:hypothetical protein